MIVQRQLGRKERVGLAIAIGFLCLVFLDRLVLAPLGKRMTHIRKETHEKERELAMDLRNLSQKAALNEEYQKYLSSMTLAGSDEEQSTTMLGEVEMLARKANILIKEATPQTPRAFEFYKQYSMEISGEGTMAAVINFLYSLNASPQLLRVERISINSQDLMNPLVKAYLTVTKVKVVK